MKKEKQIESIRLNRSWLVSWWMDEIIGNYGQGTSRYQKVEDNEESCIRYILKKLTINPST